MPPPPTSSDALPSLATVQLGTEQDASLAAPLAADPSVIYFLMCSLLCLPLNHYRLHRFWPHLFAHKPSPNLEDLNPKSGHILPLATHFLKLLRLW